MHGWAGKGASFMGFSLHNYIEWWLRMSHGRTIKRRTHNGQMCTFLRVLSLSPSLPVFLFVFLRIPPSLPISVSFSLSLSLSIILLLSSSCYVLFFSPPNLFPPMALPDTRFLHPGLHGRGRLYTFVDLSNFLRFRYRFSCCFRMTRDLSENVSLLM